MYRATLGAIQAPGSQPRGRAIRGCNCCSWRGAGRKVHAYAVCADATSMILMSCIDIASEGEGAQGDQVIGREANGYATPVPGIV
eukprot:52085-Rhodomonas_salina.1